MQAVYVRVISSRPVDEYDTVTPRARSIIVKPKKGRKGCLKLAATTPADSSLAKVEVPVRISLVL